MTSACPACVAAPAALDEARAARPDLMLAVPGLHCARCIQSVEAALAALPGVESARVNLTLKRVSVSGTAPKARLIEALRGAGFEAHPFDPGAGSAASDATARDLLLRIGVSGFAMMNVMLLSVAVWSGASDATRDLFHLISAAIALPATLFAAQPFFRHALEALRAGRLNMDVPISLAIVLAAGMSLFEALNGGAHAYFDAALSLSFFLLVGRALEHRTRAAARSAAADLSALEAQTAVRITPAGREDVELAALAPGDTLHVATGMRAPVDGTLLAATALTDRSFLTGESDPATSQTGETIHAGEINIGAPFRIRATAVGEETSLRQMARLVETAETARTRYTSLADRAAQIYAPAVHLLAAATFLGWYGVTGDLRVSLNAAIAVLIITCPCALGLAVPAVATAAIGRLYELGFLVKSGTALERLAGARHVFLDKTGTLTQPGVSIDAETLTPGEREIAKALADASSHPVSRALSAALEGVTPAPLNDITEHPGQGVSARAGDLPVALGRAEWFTPGAEGLSLKTGACITPLPVSEVMREGAAQMVAALATSGRATEILSGDTEAKTTDVAQTLGATAWHGGLSPAQKHARITEREESGLSTVMLGDGINDTAALSAATASIAPGTALDAARNAADIVVLKPSLAGVPQLFRIAEMSVALSRQNFAIAAAYNAIAIPVAVAGFASPMLAALAMSASSITVLLNAMRVKIVS